LIEIALKAWRREFFELMVGWKTKTKNGVLAGSDGCNFQQDCFAFNALNMS